MRWKAPNRTRMLASEAATASLSSRMTSCRCSSIPGLPIIIMKATQADRTLHLSMLNKVAEANFPSRFGHFRIFGFESRYGGAVEESVVLRMGDLRGDVPPLVRIHSQCLTGDVFHSLRCDCRSQLELA